MGLGFFIAKTLLERSGATVALENRAAAGHGRRRQGELAARGVREPHQRPLSAEAGRRLARSWTGHAVKNYRLQGLGAGLRARYARVYGLWRH